LFQAGNHPRRGLRPPSPGHPDCLPDSPRMLPPAASCGHLYSGAEKSAIGSVMPRLRRVLRWVLVALACLALIWAIGPAILYRTISADLPDVSTLRQIELQEPLYVHTSDGRLMAVFGEARRTPVTIDQVPPRLRQAFLAIEDARFYEHGGVDYKGTGRAIWLMLSTRSLKVPGGSTITQQVARQFYLSPEVKLKRKAAEMLLAMRMEDELSKDEILALYLNKSFF